MTIALRPLRPVRPLLRKDADQLGLFGDVTPVKLTPKAKARAKLYGNVAAPVVPKPKAAPKPTATPGKKPKEGDTRTNRAGNKEVLRGGRWRLADNPQVIAKDKPAAIVPVVEDLREADLVDEALPQITLKDEPAGGDDEPDNAPGLVLWAYDKILKKLDEMRLSGDERKKVMDQLYDRVDAALLENPRDVDGTKAAIKAIFAENSAPPAGGDDEPEITLEDLQKPIDKVGPATVNTRKNNKLKLSPIQESLNDFNKTNVTVIRVTKGTRRNRARGGYGEVEVYNIELNEAGDRDRGGYWPHYFSVPVSKGKKALLEALETAKRELREPRTRPLPRKRRKVALPQAGSENIDLLAMFSNPERFTPEPTPEPMLEEAGGMAGEVPGLKPKGRGKSSKPDGAGSDRPGPRRAKAGGEYGPNNEWYEGGKFIPSEDKPKVLGSKKAKPKEEGEEQSPAKKAKVEKRSPRPVPVGPDEMAVLPKGKSSIYLYLSGRYIKPVGDDGIMQIKDPDVLNAQLEMDYQQAKSRGSLVANHGMISELVRRWNDGERFYDSEEFRSMMDSPRKGERSEVPGAIAGDGGDGSESAGDGVSGRSGGFSGKDRLPDMEPAKVEVGTYSPILRYPPREQKGKRQWVDMAKQHTPEDWRRIGDFFENKLKNLGAEEIPMTMGKFQSDFSNEDIKDHLNLVQGTITARKVQKYPDFARAMNLMELYAGLHPQMKFIIWPRPESRYAAYPDDSPSAKPKTENDQHMRRLLRLMNEALDTPGRERVTLPDRTVQRRSPAPSLQAPPGFRVNKFGGVASDGTQVAAGEGYIRNEDGRWKIYSKDQVDNDGNILTKSLRPYPGPYLTLLGVRYVLDGGILRKAARKSTLNTGDTKTVNGVTYTFNENRRWARADKKAKTPRAKAAPKAARPPVASIPILEDTPKVKGKPRGMKPKAAPNAQVEGASKQARRGVARSVSAEGLKPKAKPTQLKPKAGASPEAKPEASQGIVLAKKDSLTAKSKGKPKGKQKAKAADVDSRYATANPTDEQAKNFLKDKTDEFLGDPKSDRKEAIKEVHDRFKKTKVKDKKTYVQAVLRNQEISIENWDRDGQSWMADNKSKIKRVESRLTDAKTDKARKRAQLDLDKLLQEKTELEAGLRNIEELRKKPQEQRIAEAEQRYEQDIKQATQDRANRRAAYQKGDKKVVSEVNREVRSNLIRPMLDDPEFEDYIPARNMLTGRVEQPSVLEQAKAYLRLVHRSGGGDASALGLDTAKPSLEELRRAYRKKAVEAHPDQGGSREAFEAVRDSYERLMKKHYPDLLKSLQSGPYVTLLGVRYILDGGILRKAGMSWEDFRCEAEAMHKEAQGDDDPCWKGYEAVGLKRKGKRMVPNCVPVSR